MTTVRMVVIELTLFMEEEERERPDHLGLEDIAREMDSGSFIGAFLTAFEEVVEPSRLRDVLLALGNDGAFFEDAYFPEP